MRINLTSVFVDDQDKALRFYTEVLGFQKKTEVPVGRVPVAHGGLAGGAGGPELVLEPDGHPAVGPFKAALVQRRHPVYLVRSGRRRGRVRAAARPRGAVHPGARADGAGDDRSLG